MNTITAIDDREINKEPAAILIDKRLDEVKDWKKLLKDSSKNKIIINNSNLVKNR